MVVNDEINTGFTGIIYWRRADFHHMFLAMKVPESQILTYLKPTPMEKNRWRQHMGLAVNMFKLEKFGGILGPLVFALAVGQSGSSRIAILWVIGFFVVGGVLLAFVNVPEGERQARAADAHVRIAS